MELDTDQLDRSTPVEVPNATAVLILGIFSIVSCVCYGLPGLVLGIVALVLAKPAKALYFSKPSAYTKSSYDNLNAGYICALIGTVMSGIIVLIFLVYLIVIVTVFSGQFENFDLNNL